jgi:pentatricopeptide repeat domain-containing protein 1
MPTMFVTCQICLYSSDSFSLIHRLKASSPIPIIAINSLIAACGRGNRPDLALALLNEMRSNFGLRPDERSYRSAVIACNVAQHKVQGLQSGRLDANESDFEWIDFSVEWWECALALFRRMREETLIPDKKTYSSVISACEAAGEWQRAIGVLEIMIEEAKDGDDFGSLNLYCFNSAISACEKGSAWVEALEIYERMIVIGGPISPNFITLSSMVLALEKAGQKELAQAKFEEGIRKRIVKPWRWTRNQAGECIYALVSHFLYICNQKIIFLPFFCWKK